MYVCIYIYIYIYIILCVCIYIYIYIHTYMYVYTTDCSTSNQKWEVGGIRLKHPPGWRMLRPQPGSLAETFRLEKPTAGLKSAAYAWDSEGYGFIEFEISNSTISTVFRQPLTYALTYALPWAAAWSLSCFSPPGPPATCETVQVARGRRGRVPYIYTYIYIYIYICTYIYRTIHNDYIIDGRCL